VANKKLPGSFKIYIFHSFSTGIKTNSDFQIRLPKLAAMDKFIVSARKYRPQNFSTVVGQAHITTTLKNAIKNNQLAHAFLFCGPRGVGKTTCARILAKTINCENQTPEGEACNTCHSCVSFDAGTSMNIHELDAASNNSVDDIRVLVDNVRFAPQAGKYKVYIVDEVHMLSSSAFNAFLKTLEEPPSHAIFILATTEKHKILPTILSRCQIFDFKRITNNDTIEHLQEICDKEKIKAEKAALHVIAQKSEGCMRDALSILDKIVSFSNGALNYSNTLEHLNILDEDYYFKLLDCMMQQQLSDAMLLYDEINRKGFEGDTLLEGYSEFVRNLLVSKDAKAAILLEVADDFKQKYLQAAQQIATGWLIAALNLLNDAEINYKQARNKRLHVELTIIKLCYLLQAVELVNNESGISKKKVIETTRPVAFKSIQPIRVKEQEVEIKPDPLSQNKEAAKLIIEEPEHGVTIKIIKQAEPVIAETKKPLGSLDAIRKKVSAQNKTNGNEVKELTVEELQIAWQLFINRLEERNNPAAVTNFKNTLLNIPDNNLVEIIVKGELQKTFIENERADLIEHLQQFFKNRFLVYRVTVVEDKNEDATEDIPLTRKQQYQRIIEEYPLVEELRKRLRLELD
jgi:DNA polymerase-3 subunit gamma/tau